MKKSLLIVMLCLAPIAPSASAGAAPDDGGQRAHFAVRSGEFVALEVLVKDALERVPGEVIDVELDDDEYEIEVLAADGIVWELDYNARSGDFIEMERDD